MAIAEAILVEVAKTLVVKLGTFAYEEVAFGWGLKTQLDKLKKTTETIAALLQDVEEEAPSNSSTHTDRDWLNKLRIALYEADDLFDEIWTLAERKRFMEGNAFRKEVCLFFSSSNQLVSCFKVAQRVKAIRGELSDISSDRRDFGNAMRPVVRVVDKEREIDLTVGGVSRESCSYVDDKEIVGRNAEKISLVKMLLDSTAEEVVSVIPIVGVGGLGKTTLAQLVYNDKIVRESFDLMLWVFVPHEIRLKEVIRDVIASATRGEKPSDFSLEQLVNNLSRHITGKKYMLVLDDVWDEDPRKWESLKPFLTRGASHGSKILVTTRSLIVGRIMGTVPPYELQPLIQDESLSLFLKIAFQKEGHELGVRELVWEILGLCKNIPLVIRVIAGVLANKLTLEEWSLFIADDLSNFELYEDNVMPILKLSYDYLSPKEKACFSYCSLFPRGYEFDKSKLVSLWIAQGFIDQPHCKSHMSWEVVGKKYLDNLLNKSLLEGNESEDTCKLHDLMYDLCCLVGGGQCRMVSSLDNPMSRSTRHLSIGYQVDSSWKTPKSIQNIKQLRTFLFTERPCYGMKMSLSMCENLISSFHCLRVLDLHELGIRKLPKSIGKLIHLRYLDLSSNSFLRKLPDSVALLHNLQYLDLQGNIMLTISLDLKKLVNLRHFLLPSYLATKFDFPPGIGSLSNLQTLNMFSVTKYSGGFRQGQYKSSCSRLSDLCNLNNLKGELFIYMWNSYRNMAVDAGKANLKAKKNLEALHLSFHCSMGAEESEPVLENLQPHDKLSDLEISKYQGVKLPTWMAKNQLATFLPHLTSISFWECPNVQELPSFAHLPHLKSLELWWSNGVEYIESGEEYEASCSSSSTSSSNIFFPSLTRLVIMGLCRLKGWSRSSTRVENLSFLQVSEMRIGSC